MDRFKNKIALVTGAGSGIGRSTAVRLDQEGATLIIADINEDQLNETKNMLTNKASSAMVLDISDLEQTQACFQTVKKEYKTLDALINVAGILRFDNSHEVKIEDWNKILNVNLTGTFFMCNFGLPMLLKSKGYIVNVSSTAALGSHAWTAAYSASKGGISAFSKTLAVIDGSFLNSKVSPTSIPIWAKLNLFLFLSLSNAALSLSFSTTSPFGVTSSPLAISRAALA
jgi:meso-butanediol dehydrogenase/(S,S)-butanediol dehydrogenase/diacetyl reductase